MLRGVGRDTKVKASIYKSACGMCSKPIMWDTPNKTPLNKDGTNHFLSCNFVSEARKREIKESLKK